MNYRHSEYHDNSSVLQSLTQGRLRNKEIRRTKLTLLTSLPLILP